MLNFTWKAREGIVKLIFSNLQGQGFKTRGNATPIKLVGAAGSRSRRTL